VKLGNGLCAPPKTSLTKEIEMATESGKSEFRGKALKVLGLVGVMSAAAFLQACGGGTPSGRIRATWSLTENGASVSCRAGDEVDVRVDTDAMTIPFACSDGVGITPEVSCGVSHVVSLSLYDADGNLLSSTGTMNVLVPCGVIQDTPPVVFEVGSQTCAPGQIKTTWFLSQNGQQVACAPGDEVDLRVDTDAMTVTFPCADLMGTSPSVTGGVSHQVSLKLFDKNGNVLSETGVMSLNVPCGTVMNTPRVEFSLTP
jgi:hypothetical protein